MMDKNYYEMLEISEEASPEVIKAAYKTLVKKYHPDSFCGDGLVRTKTLQEINIAYEVLSNPNKRKAYDEDIRKSRSMGDKQKKEYSQEFDVQKNGNGSMEERPEESTEEKTQTDSKESVPSRIGKFLGEVGVAMIKSILMDTQKIEKAYMEGISCDEKQLLRKYNASSGYRRLGYIKALEERGFLERGVNGEYRVTEKFKRYDR